jgi:hypothetical protein
MSTNEPPVFEMFKERTNFELRHLALDLLNKKIPDPLYNEIFKHEKGRGSDSTQFKRLNKTDLLKIIYISLLPEITRIDTSPLEEVPLLLNEEWSVPELKERVRRRLEYVIPATGI